MSHVEREHELRIVLRQEAHGEVSAEVWALLRSGGLFCAARQSWPAGAPTPSQLILFEAAVCDELQTLILTHVGVQGVLFRNEIEEEQLDRRVRS